VGVTQTRVRRGLPAGRRHALALAGALLAGLLAVFGTLAVPSPADAVL